MVISIVIENAIHGPVLEFVQMARIGHLARKVGVLGQPLTGAKPLAQLC